MDPVKNDVKPATAPKPKGKSGRKTPPPNETKEQRFRRLAMLRVPKAIRALANIERLGNRTLYAPSESQCDKIIEVLGVACQRVFANLKGSQADIQGFSL